VQKRLKELKKQYQAGVTQLHEHQNQHDPKEFLANLCVLHTAMTPTASIKCKFKKKSEEKENMKFILINGTKWKPLAHEKKGQPMTSRPAHAVR